MVPLESGHSGKDEASGAEDDVYASGADMVEESIAVTCEVVSDELIGMSIELLEAGG